MKRIYITSDNLNGAFIVGENSLLFKHVNELLYSSIKLKDVRIGVEDIELNFYELTIFKVFIEKEITKKIKTFKEDKRANTKVVIFDTILKLYIRKDEDNIINLLVRLLELVDLEIKRSGCLYIYSLSMLDDRNTCIINMLKHYQQKELLKNVYSDFVNKFQQYRDMNFKEFMMRIDDLEKDSFVFLDTENKSTVSEIYIYPSSKTKNIHV